MEEIKFYLLFAVIGFVSGSILYGKLLPKIFCKKDICAISDDNNPGTANTYIHCGVVLGTLCLFLELIKGFLPVFIASRYLDIYSPWFSLVLVAPVLGHAVGLFNHFIGGKAICTSFGVLLGIVYESSLVFILAVIYVLLATVFKVKPNRVLSIVTYTLFMIFAGIYLIIVNHAVLLFAVAGISLIVITKHTKYFELKNKIRVEEEQLEEETKII